jgi:hypothetical protein
MDAKNRLAFARTLRDYRVRAMLSHEWLAQLAVGPGSSPYPVPHGT